MIPFLLLICIIYNLVRLSIEKKCNYNFQSFHSSLSFSFFRSFFFFSSYTFKATFMVSTMTWHIRTPSSIMFRPMAIELFTATWKYTSLIVSKISIKFSIGVEARIANSTASLRAPIKSDEPSSNAFATCSRAATICDLASFEYFERVGNFNRSSTDLSTLVKLTVPKLPFATATKRNIIRNTFERTK